jgi:hypothetical protein
VPPYIHFETGSNENSITPVSRRLIAGSYDVIGRLRTSTKRKNQTGLTRLKLD